MNRSIIKFSMPLALLTLSNLSVAGDDFYNQTKRGWFWHETAPKPELQPEELPAESQSSKVEDKMVNIDAEWLKKNLPELQSKAINDPSPENLGAFYAAQRLTLDISSKFASKTSDFFRKEANWLSEDHRRPTESFMLSRFKSDLASAQRPVIEKVSKQAGIWFFFSSTCTYCVKQLPLITYLSDTYNMNVLYISLDGGTMPGIPENKIVMDVDGRVSSEFNVSVTPTTFLVSNDASKFELLSNGVSALPKLQNSIVSVAHKYDWISDSEYNSVRAVRGSNVLENGQVQIKESELNNPVFLFNALQTRVDLSSSPIGTPVRSGAQ
jgi:conjugal transfer pilus assembly protein TraF